MADYIMTAQVMLRVKNTKDDYDYVEFANYRFEKKIVYNDELSYEILEANGNVLNINKNVSRDVYPHGHTLFFHLKYK